MEIITIPAAEFLGRTKGMFNIRHLGYRLAHTVSQVTMAIRIVYDTRVKILGDKDRRQQEWGKSVEGRQKI